MQFSRILNASLSQPDQLDKRLQLIQKNYKKFSLLQGKMEEQGSISMDVKTTKFFTEEMLSNFPRTGERKEETKIIGRALGSAKNYYKFEVIIKKKIIQLCMTA